MLINKRCTVCHTDIETADRVTCTKCGNELHEQCADYETTFKCPQCADEPWIEPLEY